MKRVQNKMWWYNTSTIQTSGSVINTVSSVSDRLVNKIVKKKNTDKWNPSPSYVW